MRNAVSINGLRAWQSIAPIFSCNIVAASRLLTRVVVLLVLLVRLLEGPEACGRSDPGPMV